MPARRKPVPQTKVFGGKRYRFGVFDRTKNAARRHAKQYRSRTRFYSGARVAKVDGGYAVYVKDKR